MSENEFSVYWWYENGHYQSVQYIPAEAAIKKSLNLVEGDQCKAGLITRIIVTDDGDCIAFEWLKDKGVVFPTPPATKERIKQ